MSLSASLLQVNAQGEATSGLFRNAVQRASASHDSWLANPGGDAHTPDIVGRPDAKLPKWAVASVLGASALGIGLLVLIFRLRGTAIQPKQYTHVQYLGFNLFTAPGTSADGCFGVGDDLRGSCYFGSLQVEEDIHRRQGIMTEAIERAFASPHWDRRPTTLKVFMAPEFYWRGPRGAYRVNARSANASRDAVRFMMGVLRKKRFANWLFVLGTVVAAQEADIRYVQATGLPFENISYYNFAPVHIGGTTRVMVQFKHFISGIDFLHTQPAVPRARLVKPPPGISHVFCRQHPESNGCTYGKIPLPVLAEFGFDRHEIVKNGIFEIGGLRVGIEICLDHAMGDVCKKLGWGQSLDLQLIVSAGMNIASGPVCTALGGPVFLADGFARTELSLNQFGHGTESSTLPNGATRYNVGIVYGADALVALQQWISDTIDSFTRTGFGTRFPGEGTLPGGSTSAGETGIRFKQISALGEDWLSQISGFYMVANYLGGQGIYDSMEQGLHDFLRAANRALPADIERAAVHPTIDIYGPLPLQP